MSKRKSEQPLAQGTNDKSKKMELFRTRGEFQDEITFLFDDGKQLFARSSFLKTISPEFKAWLESELKEKSTGVIPLIHKTYADFLEFLEVLHPALEKHITEQNVHILLPLAHEYEVTTLIIASRDTLSSIISRVSNELQVTSKNCLSFDTKPCDMTACLEVLLSAVNYSYNEVKINALALLAVFHTRDLNGNSEAQNKNSELFSLLPDQVKVELLLARLRRLDDDGIVFP